MIKLVLLAVAGLMAASQFGLLPHGQAAFVLSAAIGTVVMVWIGLFARI
ncbi:MAG: hypothetical protein JNK84_13050 [Phreatobacter sp.]|nr:hypothetical protein [Phreatobacter sp.]MBL8569990.1 hypothetical protein [Phreatobacter sp.]